MSYTKELFDEIDKFDATVKKIGYRLHKFDGVKAIPVPEDSGDGYKATLMIQIESDQENQ